ncbi:MAG: hypothetical protein L3J04_06790 [Robiginitomaculum sp.]|nr:hypothetical protein [Robiginitomaculum sp.]
MRRREFLVQGTALGLAGFGIAACSPQAAGKKSIAVDIPQFKLDATAQSKLILSGETSSLELTGAAIERASKVNEALNFIVNPTFEQARERAASTLPAGPFSGVPTMTKDLTATKGVRAAFGSRAFAEYVPKRNARFANVMQGAGLVSIGKSATPEFGFLPVTEPLMFGPTRNPWNSGHTCGGSSGGAAVAVATGVVPLAHASDGGGSIRIPASCCGLFGMKGSRGRWPDTNGGDWEISINGFVTRSVRDSQTAMASMTDANNGLPSVVLADADRGKKYKIGFRTATPDGREVHADCKRAVLLAAKHCAQLGHEVVEVPAYYSWREFWDAFMVVWAFGAKEAIDSVGQQLGGTPPRELFEPFTWWLYDMVADKGHSAVGAAYTQFAVEREAARKFHQTYDFCLSPVLGEPPIKVGSIDQSGEIEAMRDWLEHYVGFTLGLMLLATRQCLYRFCVLQTICRSACSLRRLLVMKPICLSWHHS